MEDKKVKTVILSELDVEILSCLYKSDFLSDKQLAVLVGENMNYIKGRCKKLANAGLIGRKVIRDVAANYISKKGVKEAGLAPRNIHEPKLSKYEHSLGFIDSCVWFARYRTFKDGSFRSWIPFGSIITERDFIAVREMQVVKHRADGQPVYVSADKDIHAPDGYFRRSDGSYAAIEFERTQKSSNRLLKANVLENLKRFKLQYWIFDDPYIGKSLNKIRAEVGDDRMIIYDIRKIRSDIDRYVDTIPTVISSKSGIPRNSCLGKMVEPTPLNRIPLLPGYHQSVVLESRAKAPADSSGYSEAPAPQPVITVSKSSTQTTMVSSQAATQSVTSPSRPSTGKSLFLERR